jgi:hypothetical protein
LLIYAIPDLKKFLNSEPQTPNSKPIITFS